MKTLPKIGTRVRLLPKGKWPKERGWDTIWWLTDGMVCNAGKVLKVSGHHAPDFIYFEGAESDCLGAAWVYHRDLLVPVKETAKQRATRLKKERAAAAKEARAKAEAEKARIRAEVEKEQLRNEAYTDLPAPAQAAVRFLRRDKSAFGCQRDNVLGLVAALTFSNVHQIKKAL